jgi:hypothetical protein
VWLALKQICLEMEAGNVSSAQSILDASKCTCPTGDIRDGVWDDLGNLYRIPAFCLSSPLNLIDEDTFSKQTTQTRIEVGKSSVLESISPSRETPSHITLVLRMQSGQDYRMKLPGEITTFQLRLLALESSSLLPPIPPPECYTEAMKNWNVRIFYLGRMLGPTDDSKRIRDVVQPIQGVWGSGSVVVQIMVTPRQ